MPEVTRTAGAEGVQNEGFEVVTRTAGAEYTYRFTVVEPPEDDEPGTVRCVERRRYDTSTGKVEQLDPDTTESVEEALSDYGFQTE